MDNMIVSGPVEYVKDWLENVDSVIVLMEMSPAVQ